MSSNKKFGMPDWTVFIITLLISASIGIYHAFSGGKQKTTGEFLMGNRKMSIVPVAISILASFLSSILILGAPAEMYTRGTQYYLYLFGQMGGAALAAVIFVPLFYPLKMTSMYQYLELRFKSRAVRLAATGINMISLLIYTGITSFAPATALQAVSGFPEWGSFLIIGVVCTFYTFLGGFKAVVWVDVFQAVIMLTGLLTVVVKATSSVGGFDELWELNKKWERIEFWDFNPDPTVRHTFWALVVGGMINWTGIFGASQQSIQRFSSLPTLKQAKIAVLLNCVGLFIMVTSACLAGIAVFAYFAITGCDPLSNNKIRNANQLLPFFVMQTLGYPGVPGIFIACLFSASLSSVSSNVSSMVATSWEDLVKPLVKHKAPRFHTWITKALVLLFGALGVGVAFLVGKLGGTVLQASLSFMGAAGGALNGMIVLGAFFPWTNWVGALVGPLTSYLVMMWIGISKYSVLSTEYLPSPTSGCLAGQNQSEPFVHANINISYPPQLNTTPFDTIISTLYNTTTITTDIDDVTMLSGLDRLYSLSYLWYSTLGSLISVIVGLTVSFLTGYTTPGEVNPDYLAPVVRKLCCCRDLRMNSKRNKGNRNNSLYTKRVDEDDEDDEDDDADNESSHEMSNGLSIAVKSGHKPGKGDTDGTTNTIE